MSSSTTVGGISTVATHARPHLLLFINGQRFEVPATAPWVDQTLIEFIRSHRVGLAGTKYGCGEGGCGACTVMVSHRNPRTGIIDHRSVNACLTPLVAVDHCSIVTVEGIGSLKTGLHPIQERMTKLHGSQCGFCTPGFVMSMYALLRNNPHPTEEEIHEAVSGNLCRCTGYRPIYDVLKTFVDEGQQQSNGCGGSGTGGGCCRSNRANLNCDETGKSSSGGAGGGGGCCGGGGGGSSACCKAQSECSSAATNKPEDAAAPTTVVMTSHFGEQTFRRYDPSSEIIFPPELMRSKPQFLDSRGEYSHWLRPTTLAELLALRAAHPHSKLVCGNTELHIEQKFRNIHYPCMISMSAIDDEALRQVHVVVVPPDSETSPPKASNGYIQLGGAATWTEVQCALRTALRSLNDSQTNERLTIESVLDQLRWFAGLQIRNVGTVAGNLVTASPISDVSPVLWAAGADVHIIRQQQQQQQPHPATASAVEHVTEPVASLAGEIARRTVPVSRFFTGYRTVDLQPGELVEFVRIPLARTPFQYTRAFKQSRRREDDIAIVTCAFRVRLDPDSWTVREACLSYGGMAPTTVSCPQTSAQMIGRPWDTRLLSDAVHWIAQDLPLAPDAPGGMVEYRRLLARNLFFKFFWFVDQQFRADLQRADLRHHHHHHNRPHSTTADSPTVPPPSNADSLGLSATDLAIITAPYHRPPHLSLQVFPSSSSSSSAPSLEPVGLPIPHRASDVQNTGEAQYTADVELPQNALHGALVVSDRGHGRIRTIVTAEALRMPGVHSWVDVHDVPGSNHVGPLYKDELLFCVDEVTGFGQLIGIILADTERHATEAARRVHVEYEVFDASLTSSEDPKHPTSVRKPVTFSTHKKAPILTIADAIRENSFFEFDREIRRGDPTAVFNSVQQQQQQQASTSTTDDNNNNNNNNNNHNIDVTRRDGDSDSSSSSSSSSSSELTIIEGDVHMGGQEHFYLEPNVAVATPGEHGELHVIASTQSLTKTQSLIAAVLNVPANRVVCKAKRLGGGFGGKETRNLWIACAAAVCARRTGRTVRVLLDRDMDMKTTGTRHPYFARYRVAHDPEGRIVALDADVYNNAGWSYDLSMFVMERTLMHMDGPYTFPNVHVRGHLCRTEISTSTAFRGFGLPQSTLIVETIVEHVARSSRRPANDVRRLQLCRAGDRGLTGFTVADTIMSDMWDQVLRDSEFDRRQAEITEFNSKSRYRKRGIHALPTRFGIGFDACFMHQASALVHIYTDGSVLVTHAGVEMGQGLHTKMIQIAAQALGVPVDSIYISETATDKIHNTTTSAASVQSDFNGPAVEDACKQLAARLAPYRERMPPNTSMADIATAAYFDRVDLCARGFFRTEDFGFDWATGAGQAVVYNSYGTAVVESEVDVLTGDLSILRTDILMDVGRSLNPAIDIGQIEGAFVQGLGLYLMEEVVWTQRGLFTQGPSTYKIPTMNDIPIDFRVRLFDHRPEHASIHSSKGIGEPPLLLSAASFFAVKDAIYSARSDAGKHGYFELQSPATCERIALATSSAV